MELAALVESIARYCGGWAEAARRVGCSESTLRATKSARRRGIGPGKLKKLILIDFERTCPDWKRNGKVTSEAIEVVRKWLNAARKEAEAQKRQDRLKALRTDEAIRMWLSGEVQSSSVELAAAVARAYDLDAAIRAATPVDRLWSTACQLTQTAANDDLGDLLRPATSVFFVWSDERFKRDWKKRLLTDFMQRALQSDGTTITGLIWSREKLAGAMAADSQHFSINRIPVHSRRTSGDGEHSEREVDTDVMLAWQNLVQCQPIDKRSRLNALFSSDPRIKGLLGYPDIWLFCKPGRDPQALFAIELRPIRSIIERSKDYESRDWLMDTLVAPVPTECTPTVVDALGMDVTPYTCEPRPDVWLRLKGEEGS